MVHKSNTAFLKPKMLLLYIFLVSCSLPGSMGGAVEEFQENLKAVVGLAKKEIFLPVAKGKFQCSQVPCQLKRTIERLKVSFENDPARTHISLMEKNMNHITSTLKKSRKQPQKIISCPMKDLPLKDALDHFDDYFEKVNENCWKS